MKIFINNVEHNIIPNKYGLPFAGGVFYVDAQGFENIPCSEHYIPSHSANQLIGGRCKSVKIGGNVYSLSPLLEDHLNDCN